MTCGVTITVTSRSTRDVGEGIHGKPHTTLPGATCAISLMYLTGLACLIDLIAYYKA